MIRSSIIEKTIFQKYEKGQCRAVTQVLYSFVGTLIRWLSHVVSVS